MDLMQKFSQHFNCELQYLEEAIDDTLHHDVKIIKDILHHVVSSGGKRFRPLLLMASHSLVGGKDLKKSATMGAAIELIHTATLLHDDVVDENDLRRGKKTANHIWGNSYTILSGDYLFTKAFHLLTQSKNFEILNVVSNTAMEIASGEVLQMMNIKNFDMSLETNIKIIKAKTARLISAACRIGGIVGGGSLEEQNALGEYGEYLGILFQITDDILDYTGDTQQLGKPIGTDFWEGKITLPLLYALQNASPNQRENVKTIMKEQNNAKFEYIKQFVEDCKGIEKAMDFAKQMEGQAIASLLYSFSNSKTRKLLEELTQNCLVRVI